MTDDQTAVPVPPSTVAEAAPAPAPAPRSVFGTVWRALVVMLMFLGVAAAAAWVGSKVLPIDGRLLEAPAGAVMVLVIALGFLVLRARIWFAVVPALAANVAACAGAVTLQDHLFTAGRLHLDTLGARLTAGSLAVALLVSVGGILTAAVSGHRHPREDSPADQPA